MIARPSIYITKKRTGRRQAVVSGAHPAPLPRLAGLRHAFLEFYKRGREEGTAEKPAARNKGKETEEEEEEGEEGGGEGEGEGGRGAQKFRI